MQYAVLVLLLTAPLALPAFAGDGRREINQTCALAPSGCFSGDAAGFPVTIDGSAGKSYVLTGGLQVPNVNSRGIEIQTSNVTVDLGGFEIRGLTTCSGTPLVCAPLGSGEGVAVSNTFLITHVTVANGAVIGMGNHGVVVGQRGVVENVHSTQNGNVGIFGDRGAVLRDNVARLNGVNGLQVAFYGTLTANASRENAAVGIFAGQGSTVIGNTSFQNGGDGMFVGDGSTIVDNNSYDNGDATNPALDDGIECGSGCTVRGNNVRDNSGVGIRLGTDSAYRENVVTNNATGGIAGAGSANARGDNYCAGTGVLTAFCP